MKPIDYFLDLTEGRVPIPKNLNIRAIEEVVESNAFTLAIQSIRFRAARRIGKRRGFIGNAWSIFPRSMRARNSGVTMSAPLSRIGKRWTTCATPSVTARELTSTS